MEPNGNNTPNRRNDGTSQVPKNRGVWDSEAWWCDCEPRHRLTERRVQAGENKDEYYWKCFKAESCGFFLWSRKALQLQAAGIDPAQVADLPKTPSSKFKQRKITAYAKKGDSAAAANPFTTPTTGSKRTRDAFEGQDGDGDARLESYSDLDSEEERTFLDIERRTSEKAASKKIAYTTPSKNSSASNVQNGLATPGTISRNLFPQKVDQSNKKGKETLGGSKTVSFQDELGTSIAATTPNRPLTTSGERGSASTSTATLENSPRPTSSPLDSNVELTNEVLAILETDKVQAGTYRNVRQALENHSAKTKGLEQSCNRLRVELQEHQRQNKELQSEISALKDSERDQNRLLTSVKRDLMNTTQKI